MTMPYSDGEIRSQLRLGEDSGWEFKAVPFRDGKPIPGRDDWADEIAAFANARGGVLLLGVSDAGEVVGMSRQALDIVERAVREICQNSIKPAVLPQVYRRELDERSFLLVSISEGDAQYDSPGGSFIRVGSAKRPMQSEERMRLAQRRGQARSTSFDERTVAGTGFAALEERLWKPLLSAESLAHPQIGLEKLGLLAPDEHGAIRATIAGVLLCTEEPQQFLPHAVITAVRYRGRDRASGQIDAKEITGPLNRQITQALAFAVGHMRVAAHKSPAREDLPEYSTQALFEAIVNAVVHRDYSIRGSRIRLSMFSDRLELCSPGGLPNSLTIESMGERQSTRNEVITSRLSSMDTGAIEGSRTHFMERRGDGVPIIRRETKGLTGKEPQFRLIDDSELCLTLPAAEIPAAGGDSGPVEVVVTVRRDGQPLPDADVLALFPNNTPQRALADREGEARLNLHATNLPMTVFVAAEGFAAHVERDWIPAERALAVELTPVSSGGSIVFQESTGSLPGLNGRLNPILDTSRRTFLYASNIAINGGRQQPVPFVPGEEELHLMDADGNGLLVRIVAITGQSALLDYRPA